MTLYTTLPATAPLTPANAAVADSKNALPIASSPDWRSAVNDLVSAWINEGRCFSSGEVASALRLHRPDLAFSVPTLGEYIRDQFYNQALPEYPDDGCFPSQPTKPFSVPRFTTGLYPDRTPAGVQVFVYGPSATACDAHEFEVFIPKPKKDGTMETMADAPAPATPVPQPARGQGKTPVFIGGAKTALDNTTVKVAADGRIYVPRAAFEAAVHLGGTPMRGGDPVYVTQTATEVTVTLSPVPNAKVYDLWRDRGKIAFGSQDVSKPFNPGDTFTVEVAAGKITIPL